MGQGLYREHRGLDGKLASGVTAVNERRPGSSSGARVGSETLKRSTTMSLRSTVRRRQARVLSRRRIIRLLKAVDGVDLDIRTGEFFAMLGPSGSGKTTCLRLIAGFEQPNEGHIEIFGETAEGVPPYAARSIRCSRTMRCSRI